MRADHARERSLYDFLHNSFSPQEFRTELFRAAPELLGTLPESSAPSEHFFGEVVRALVRHGQVGPDLFSVLEETRPRRRPEIAALRAAWEAQRGEFPWLAELRRRLAAYAPEDSFIDHGERAIELRLASACQFLRAQQVLTPDEWEVAGAASAGLACCGASTALAERLRTTSEGLLAAPLIDAACSVAAMAAAEHVPVDAHAGHDSLRLGLLAALLELNEALTCTRAALRHPNQPPPSEGSERWWSMFMTTALTQRGPAVAQLRFEVPDRGWVDPLKQAVGIGIEARWQELRPVLAAHGVGLTLARSEVHFSEGLRPPTALLPALRGRGRAALERLKLPHLSGPPSPIERDLLRLPMPHSCCRNDLAIELSTSPRERLTLRRGDSVVAELYGEATIVHAPLATGEVYTWHLEDLTFRRPTSLARGTLLAAPADATPLDPHELARRGLWTELVRELWPRRRDAPIEELALLVRALRGGFEWLSEHARRSERRSERIDLYRAAIDTVLIATDDTTTKEDRA